MLRTLPLVVVVLVLTLAGVVQGIWTGRWHRSSALETARERLDAVPLSVGDWRGEALATDEEQRVQADAAGCIHRRYENHQTGAVVSILLVCGRPGPVAVHPPDVCFQGAGYKLAAAPARVEVPLGSSPSASFWSAEFVQPQPGVGHSLRAYWAWSATGAWETPSNTRFAFARYPVLYKLYVYREARAGAEDRAEDEPCFTLLRQLLPELQQTLFSTP
jgi:hypothetical protein